MFKVIVFVYNGFFVDHPRGDKVIADYTAEFVEWTNDPGIGVFKCSDNRERLIPSCSLIGDLSSLPEQSMENKVFFGTPSFA